MLRTVREHIIVHVVFVIEVIEILKEGRWLEIFNSFGLLLHRLDYCRGIGLSCSYRRAGYALLNSTVVLWRYFCVFYTAFNQIVQQIKNLGCQFGGEIWTAGQTWQPIPQQFGLLCFSEADWEVLCCDFHLIIKIEISVHFKRVMIVGNSRKIEFDSPRSDVVTDICSCRPTESLHTVWHNISLIISDCWKKWSNSTDCH